MSDGSFPETAKGSRHKNRSRGAVQAERQPGSKNGFLEAIPAQELIPRLKSFLDLVLGQMALATKYEIGSESSAESETVDRVMQRDGSEAQRSRGGQEQESFLVRFSGEDEDILLARNGELLLALEYLAHRWLRLPPAQYDYVRFECGDFRATRLEELKLSARVAAQRVRETGQPFPFNPMSSRDRRTIHLELNGAPGVRTISEGSGDRRHLVIYPAKNTKQ
jgi:predicted RNA-binding protein Jag